MPVSVNVSGTWRSVPYPKVNISEGWRDVQNIYVKVDGSWRAMYSYWYSYGDWGGCSVTCGGGTQTRSATCYRTGNVTCSDDYCTRAGVGKESTSQSCNTQSCEECKISSTTGITDGGSAGLGFYGGFGASGVACYCKFISGENYVIFVWEGTQVGTTTHDYVVDFNIDDSSSYTYVSSTFFMVYDHRIAWNGSIILSANGYNYYPDTSNGLRYANTENCTGSGKEGTRSCDWFYIMGICRK